MRRAVLVVLALALGAAGCTDDDPSAAAASFAGLAASYEWPAGPPAEADLLVFAERTGGDRPQPTAVVDFANVCVWYGVWLARHRSTPPGDLTEVERYMVEVVPELETFVDPSGWALEVADSARSGDEGPVSNYLRENRCDLLWEGELPEPTVSPGL